ncbi:MAG: hypothetical protein ACOH2H_25395 [Cypionkella sp.]
MTEAAAYARALERVLDAIADEAPAAVARGRLALDRALGWTRRTSWPDVAWRFSELAGGVPVELVWRPGRPGLFWTAEPAAPELSPSRRLSRGLALMRTMGAGLCPATRALIRATSITSDANWPVWISGRHDAKGDAAKFYTLTSTIPAGFDRIMPLLRGTDRPSMIGITATGARELYWTRPKREAGDLWRARTDPAIAQLADRLDAALQDWTGTGLDQDNDNRLLLSLSLNPDGEPETLATFMRVRLAGGADRVRARLLAIGGEVNPAIAKLWQAGHLRPMLLTLGATATGIRPTIGMRLVA